jgi:hypothetical protein
VIATIPTVLGISESSRLLTALRTAGIPCHRIVVNQLLSEAQGDTFIKARLREQQAALDVVAGDPALQQLRQVGGCEWGEAAGDAVCLEAAMGVVVWGPQMQLRLWDVPVVLGVGG